MSQIVTGSEQSSDRSWMRDAAAGQVGLLAFAGTLLLSASLLFSVQPIFAKMVLPYLGGAPAVWAVAMCFFQAALLAGYGYAHALNRFAPPRMAPLIHLGVCLAACLTLPFGLPSWASDVPTENQSLWLVGVMTVGVGLPFFAVAANAPLLQAWFARTGHPDAADPYFLYGASNLGSLASLLAYPFLVEPLFGVETQRTVWASGFIGLMMALGACGLLMAARVASASTSGDDDTQSAGAEQSATAASVSGTDRLAWITLAFIPSALLVAFTTHVTTDIASAPFLWVIPLATFLGTFVLVFRDTPIIPHAPVLRLNPILAAVALLSVTVPGVVSAPIQAGIAFAAFFVATLVCHRALYDLRPHASRLTEFYMLMSVGGVLGGIFAAILAPQLFTNVVEYPLLILASVLAAPGLMTALKESVRARGLPLLTIAALILMALIVQKFALATPLHIQTAAIVLVLAAAAALYLQRAHAVWLGAATCAASAVVIMTGEFSRDGYAERSFFGVSRVKLSDDGRFRQLVHGSTLHGSEMIEDADGNPVTDAAPTTYYHANAPMTRGFKLAQSRAGRAINVGVVGLGTGSLACYARPQDQVTFYEIDSVVDRIARDPKHFSYLSRCATNAETVIGDARLTLARKSAGSFDYLVIDAFSSDAVPTHLLSREALALYFDRITPGGLIAFHISNRHLELESVVAATAKTLPGIYAVFADHRKTKLLPGGTPSDVIFLTRDAKTADAIRAWHDTRDANARDTAPWTDDYADLLSAIWRNYRGPPATKTSE